MNNIFFFIQVWNAQTSNAFWRRAGQSCLRRRSDFHLNWCVELRINKLFFQFPFHLAPLKRNKKLYESEPMTTKRVKSAGYPWKWKWVWSERSRFIIVSRTFDSALAVLRNASFQIIPTEQYLSVILFVFRRYKKAKPVSAFDAPSILKKKKTKPRDFKFVVLGRFQLTARRFIISWGVLDSRLRLFQLILNFVLIAHHKSQRSKACGQQWLQYKDWRRDARAP